MAGKVTDDHLLPPPCDVQESASESDADPLTDPPGVHRLHSSAMLAELLAVPPAAVRHWVRGGLLQPVRRSGSLEWFDFPQLVVGRHLARLLGGGLSLREIDAKLAHLTPGGAPAAAVVAERIVADGRRLSIRDGDRLLGAGGQMQFTFYTDRLAGDGRPPQMMPAILPGWPPEPDRGSLPVAVPARATDDTAEILDLADDLEAAGEFAEAAEALRAVLQAQGPTAPVMFMLAELLYRAGDLTAARERYYATIEIDGDHLQARSSLGCVLAELGEYELALAALEGVLRQEPDYADAHWHVAAVLTALGREPEARHHLRRFLDLTPESPWAESARAAPLNRSDRGGPRMAGDTNDIGVLVTRLRDADATARADAAERLCRAGPAAVVAAVALVRACGDADDQVREWSTAALEELGPPPPGSTPQLVELASVAAPLVAYWAVTLLGRSGQDAAPAVPTLAACLGADDPAVAERAAWALGKVAAAAARGPLEQAAQSSNPRLARLAREALAAIG